MDYLVNTNEQTYMVRRSNYKAMTKAREEYTRAKMEMGVRQENILFEIRPVKWTPLHTVVTNGKLAVFYTEEPA